MSKALRAGVHSDEESASDAPAAVAKPMRMRHKSGNKKK